MRPHELYPTPEMGKIELSMLTMETHSVADVIVALGQFSCELLSVWSQVHNITACEDSKAIQDDLIALQGVLEAYKDLVIPVDNKEEVHDRSECFSASMREELQKLIRISNALLESAGRSIHQEECKEQSSTMGLPLECQGIRELILRWKMVLMGIKEAGCFPPERTRELETHNMSIKLLQAFEENALKSYISGPPLGMQHNYERITEHERGAIAIVGMSCRCRRGAVDTEKFWDPVAKWCGSSDPGCNLNDLVESPRADQRELLGQSRSSGVLPTNYLGAISIGTAKADNKAGSQIIFGHISAEYGAEMYISPMKTSSLDLRGVFYSCKHEFGTRQLTWESRRHCLARRTVGLIKAVPAAFLSGICAFCMHSYAVNRHGQPPKYFISPSLILSVVNNPSPLLLVAATFGHGISTLVYYYLRSTDRFRECFLGAGIIAASILGLSSGIDMESLLLGAMPIVITISLLFCTFTNALVKGFGVSVCQRQSRGFDLEKQEGR